MKSVIVSFVFYVLICINFAGICQGRVDDYRSAEKNLVLLKKAIFNTPTSFQWIAGTHEMWYVNNSRKGKVFMLVNADKQKHQPAFDHSRMAKSLSKVMKTDIDETSLPFNWIQFTADQDSIEVQIDTATIMCNLKNYKCQITAVKNEDPGSDYYWANAFNEMGNAPVISPDGNYTAFIRDHNVFIRTENSNEEYQLSHDGSTGIYYSSYMFWSPDSKMLVAYKVDPAQKRILNLIESSPASQLQPKLHEREYLKPGDKVARRFPQLFLIDEKKHVTIDGTPLMNQYSLHEIRWSKDSRFFTFEWNERGHQNYKIIRVDCPDGKVTTVVHEKSETFIDYSGKRYRYDVNDKEVIWASERSGWNHLYLYDLETGSVKNPITSGSWVVRDVIKVDEKKRRIIFTAAGIYPNQDPYLMHYCMVNFDGGGFTRLTSSNADHALSFSDDDEYFVDTYSRIDLAPRSEIYQTSSLKPIMKVQQADTTMLYDNGWRVPEVFTSTGRDNETKIWGIVIHPSNFDAQKKYPVIEMVYAGPQSFYVPKRYRGYYDELRALADLGFIVVQVDGMGTSGRSKKFHDICYKNLKDGGFPDRIRWIKALGEKYPYIDTQRVGIFGGSAGGQNAAAALLHHSDFYSVAVASCGSHDNRIDKIWWNEQWMGYPVGPHYAASSNVVHANKLNGKLMLIVGELDDNVDPASTYQLADALIKSKKDFELIVLPGVSHTGGGEFGNRKRRDFFVKHLLNVTPPSWDEIYSAKEVANNDTSPR
ncbi:MAG TPA: DPP IV N-terminal domain-containing protein [Ohtaekwangia sp.]|nr:DPP IV N-terminal domain-containing protein [Ohtaekwangia sp.]